MVKVLRLSGKWLSRYELMKNLHIKGDPRRTGTRTTLVTTIALCTLCSRANDHLKRFITGN